MSSESTESARSIELLTWLETHKKHLVVTGLAIVAAAFAHTAWKHFDLQKEQEASEALLKLDRGPLAGGKEAEPKAADYLKVATDYAGTSAAQRAQLLAAGALVEEGKYDEARAKFDEFAAQYPNGPLTPVAALGSAGCLDVKGETDKAMAAYKQVITAYANHSVAGQARIAL
ncbi:MAG: tetratricopeptide repeat protein, partial [Verrucomicrobiota bacterium]